MVERTVRGMTSADVVEERSRRRALRYHLATINVLHTNDRQIAACANSTTVSMVS